MTAAEYLQSLIDGQRMSSIPVTVNELVVLQTLMHNGVPRELPILGYLPNGQRIHPIKEGMVATACVVSCVGCHKIIRGMGGPKHGALCPTCWEAK